MAFVSNSKLLKWRPTLHPIIFSSPSLSRFSTSTSVAEPLSEPDPPILNSPSNPPQPQPQPRSTPTQPSADVIICRKLANGVWKTRVKQSIRKLVPQFDSSLVYNILHGTATLPEQALLFYRWIELSDLFTHNTQTALKMIQILTRYSKLNDARSILPGLPKKSIPYDEDMFVTLIEGYGRFGIVQEAVKIFQKAPQKTVKSYDALFKAILRHGRYVMAERYYNAMLMAGYLGINFSLHIE